MVRVIRLPQRLPKRPAATDEEIGRAEGLLGHRIPHSVRAFYRRSNGLMTESGMVIFSTSDLPERNQTYEVATYAPGYLAVGDDSGGRALLLAGEDDGLWVDIGSMDPRHGEALGMRFIDWLDAGLPASEVGRTEPPALVDVYLEHPPAGGLKAMLAVKSGLGLDTPLAALKEAMENAPARLQRSVPYGKAAVRCSRVNSFLPCLGLRAVDRPSDRIAFPP